MEELKPLSEASSPEEFKALREQHRKASEPAAEPKEPPSPASAKASETVADSETAKPKTQEKEEKPKGERTLESRIAQLRANGKHGEADAILRKTWEQQSNERFDKLEKELQEYRTRKPATEPAAAAPATQAAPATAQADDGPKAKDYDGSAPGKMYEDYLVDRAGWKIEQRSAVEKQRVAQETTKQTITRRMVEARAKYADFDEKAGNLAVGLSLPNIQKALLEIDNAADVYYHLAGNPAEADRIRGLASDDARLMQMAIIGYTLRTPAAGRSDTPPEKLRTPVSKAAPPGRQLNGIEPPPKKSTAEADDFEEFKKIRHG